MSQDKPVVETFRRLDDGTWAYQRVEGMDARVSLPSLGCEILLREIYERVSLPSEEGASSD